MSAILTVSARLRSTRRLDGSGRCPAYSRRCPVLACNVSSSHRRSRLLPMQLAMEMRLTCRLAGQLRSVAAGPALSVSRGCESSLRRTFHQLGRHQRAWSVPMSGDGSCYHAHPLLTATQRRRRTDGPDDDGRRKVRSSHCGSTLLPSAKLLVAPLVLLA